MCGKRKTFTILCEHIGLYQMRVYWNTFPFFHWIVTCSALVLDCSSANKCLLKVAAYAAQLEQYQKAIEIYEQVRLPQSCRLTVEVTLSLFF